MNKIITQRIRKRAKGHMWWRGSNKNWTLIFSSLFVVSSYIWIGVSLYITQIITMTSAFLDQSHDAVGYIRHVKSIWKTRGRGSIQGKYVSYRLMISYGNFLFTIYLYIHILCFWVLLINISSRCVVISCNCGHGFLFSSRFAKRNYSTCRFTCPKSPFLVLFGQIVG